MKLLKKIIKWILFFLKKIFCKRKINNKVKNKINDINNQHYLKKYGLNNDTQLPDFPVYFHISNEEKIKTIKIISDLEKIFTNDKNIEIEKELNNIMNKLEHSDLSYIQNELIIDKVENLKKSKDNKIETVKKIKILNKEITDIIKNNDEEIEKIVLNRYSVVNYVTLTTFFIDQSFDEIKKLEDNFKHYQFSKLYYERELNKLISRIKNLQKLHSSKKVNDEIERLRKDLHTKSKDKYDLLYNDEIFINMEKICNDFIKKVNRRVIDIKKEKKLKGEENKKETQKINEKDFYERILKRFQDLELARKLLLLSEKEKFNIKDNYGIIEKLNKIYLEFLNGSKLKFNYERNKTKLEVLKLYNDMNKLNCFLNGDDFDMVSHINYSMNDLINIAINKKDELENNLANRINYNPDMNEESILVNNKIEILKTNENSRQNNSEKKLIKKIID